MERLAKIFTFFIVLTLLYYLFPFFLPFLLALLIVIIFEPLTKKLTTLLKGNRIVASSIIFTSFFAITFLLIYFLIRLLVKEIFAIAKHTPTFLQQVLENNQHLYDFYKNLPVDRQTYINDSVMSILKKVTDFLTSTAGDIFGLISVFPNYFVALIIFLVAVYLMGIQLPNLKDAFLRFFAEGETHEKVNIVLDKLKLAVVGFLRAQLILSVLTYILTFIGLTIIGVPYVAVISLLIVIVDLLPILGTGSVLVPWAIYLLIFGNIYQGFGLIILFLFITIFRKAVEPKLFGASLGISPLATLISLYVGFEIFGIVGMILGPLVVLVVNTLEEAGLIHIKIKL